MNQDHVSQQAATTAIALANVAELTAAIIYRVAGNDISTAMNGETLTRESVQNLAMSRFRTVIANELKK